MGVRGLSTFIAKNSDRYLENWELKNTYLVIDGNNLAVQLYRWYANCMDCFGGDYDQYAQAVRTFFENLQKCNITPLIVFDGSYENKKLKTIYDRVRERVSSTKRLNPATEGSVQVMPLFLRELFTEVVLSLGLKSVRCEFEADYEMACLAKTINAPLLSYDSDFYIFDVLYVPFSTLELSPKLKSNGQQKAFHYMECKLYKVDNFLKSIGGMDKGVLPLLATVLGNDYIAANVFKDFYAQLKMVKRRRVDSEQQRKIESVIKWLVHETYDSAAKKILGRIGSKHRQKIADQITEVANGYHCVESTLLSYFQLDASHTSASSIQIRHNAEIDLSTIPDGPAEGSQGDPFTEESETVDDAPGELNLQRLQGNFPEWFIDQYRKCNFPAWFIDIAVHNRCIFIPQLEDFDKPHSHTLSLQLLSALHKIVRSSTENAFIGAELSCVGREGNNYIANRVLPYCELSLPTLNEIPGLTPEELKKPLHVILEMDEDADDLIHFLSKFDNSWKLLILSILYWAKKSKDVNKIHIYAIILCGITLNTVDKKIGYMRTIKEVYKKQKNAPQFESYLNFIKGVIPYFDLDEKIRRNPKRYYEISTLDSFTRFQSIVFHTKYLNKLLLSPYEDILISDFYNGTFIYNIYTTLKRRTDPLTYLKGHCTNCIDIFNMFLQIAIEITCRLDNISDGNKKTVKKPQRRRSNDEKESQSGKCKENPSTSTVVKEEVSKRPFKDPNNPYSLLDIPE